MKNLFLISLLTLSEVETACQGWCKRLTHGFVMGLWLQELK